jgi:hypothetical protein
MKGDKSSARPKQDVPTEMVDRLLATVRGQFCGSMTGQEWGKHSHFVKKNVVLWPAHYICRVKGFTVTAERYEAIMRGIFMEIKQHGDTGNVRYWPGYLMKCVQDHWNHHWEEYYNESKSARNLAETALVQLGRLPAPVDSAVETLASAHAVLASKAKQKRKPAVKELNLPGF